jgi:branched-chain amino acid transport system permease protein
VTEAAASASHRRFRPSRTGVIARVVASVAILAGVLLQPVLWDSVRDQWIGLAAIYAVIGLSVNVITGHAGQISLGHQAFVGIGAFISAFIVAKLGGFYPDPLHPVLPPLVTSTTNFWFGIGVAAITGGAMALILGMVALRIRGLYLALITLAFGLMAENTLFNWRSFTGGGAGLPAPRPVLFESNQAYAYLCLLFVGLFLLIDWRLVKTRAGRAVVALRNEERVAATLGINVTRYKLLAFATGGVMAGVAGALFAHWNQAVQALDFVLQTALVWILMSVVGGLGSRAGVVIGSAFFALFPLVVSDLAGDASIRIPLLGDVLVQILTPFFGALLLLLTITLYPGGIGQQILPIRRWLAGGPLVEARHELRLAGLPLLVTFLALLLAGVAVLPSALAGLAVGIVTVLLLLVYLRRMAAVSRAPARGFQGPASGPRRPEQARPPAGSVAVGGEGSARPAATKASDPSVPPTSDGSDPDLLPASDEPDRSTAAEPVVPGGKPAQEHEAASTGGQRLFRRRRNG